MTKVPSLVGQILIQSKHLKQQKSLMRNPQRVSGTPAPGKDYPLFSEWFYFSFCEQQGLTSIVSTPETHSSLGGVDVL